MNFMTRQTETNPYEKRGLNPELAAKYGAGFRNGQFCFEYRDKEGLQYRKLRSLDKKFTLDRKGVKKRLWLLHLLQDLPSDPGCPLVLTEGEFDTLTAIQCWSCYGSSVPFGAGMASPTQPGKLVADDEAFAFLWGKDERLIAELLKFKRIILAVDNDIPGQILLNELAIRIGRSRCWTVEYPSGCKDLNDVLMKYGADAVRHVLDNARPLQPGRLIKPSQIRPAAFTQTYPVAWDWLSPHLRLTRPELVVVTGVPGHGKGVFIRSTCYHLAEQYGLRTAFWAPEDRADRIKRDMLRFAQRRNLWPSREEQEQARDWIDRHFMLSELLDDDIPTIERLVDEMEAAVFHHNCQVFVIDPWNVIRHSMGLTPETRYIEEQLEILKSKARQLCLMLFIAAHPTKVKNGEILSLYSINGSANWYNKADHGIVISRMLDEAGKKTEKTKVWVEKSKDEETMGDPGIVYARYDRDRADYVHLPMAA